MKPIERITLATTSAATLAAAAILIKQALRSRAERILRIAAGESAYEHKHNRMMRTKTA